MTTRLVLLVISILAMTGTTLAHDPPACYKREYDGTWKYRTGICQGDAGVHYVRVEDFERNYGRRGSRRSYDRQSYNDRNDSDLETGLKVGGRIVEKVLDNAARRREAEAAERIARTEAGERNDTTRTYPSRINDSRPEYRPEPVKWGTDGVFYYAIRNPSSEPVRLRINNSVVGTFPAGESAYWTTKSPEVVKTAKGLKEATERDSDPPMSSRGVWRNYSLRPTGIILDEDENGRLFEMMELVIEEAQ